jgi:GTPase
LKGCGKIPVLIKTVDDALIAAQNFTDPKICPIFLVSCLDGTNLDILKVIFFKT